MRNLTDRLHEKGFEPLTIEQEKELAKELLKAKEKGDTKTIERIQQELIQRQIRLVIHIARNYKGKSEWEDLISAGIMGLTNAVMRWNPEKGYLYHWVERWIKTAIIREIDNNRTIKIPERKAKEAGLIRIEIRKQEEKLQRSLTQKELDKLIGDRLDIRTLPKAEFLIDQPTTTDEGEQFSSIIGKTSEDDDPFEIVNKKMIIESVQKAISELTEIEQEVISMRFGFNGDRKTLAEIGTKFKMTGEAMRRIESTALAKLRHPALKNQLDIGGWDD
jgi:RNA polymerase primary sigma factor